MPFAAETSGVLHRHPIMHVALMSGCQEPFSGQCSFGCGMVKRGHCDDGTAAVFVFDSMPFAGGDGGGELASAASVLGPTTP
jgi:hypothetical protein